MITSAATMPDGAVLDSDVAVVGAGPVGVALALELAGTGMRVTLVESGETTRSTAAQRLSDAASWDRDLHAPMDIAVRRQLGGTSTIWGGRCVPYDPVDFERRTVTGHQQWPVSHDDVAPYLADTCRWLVCGRPVFEAADAGPLPPSIVPGLPGAEVSTSTLERWSLPTDFGAEYKDRLVAERRVNVVVGLTCTRVRCETEERRVEHLVCRTLDGRTITVRARQYVLAAGGLESTRLLLNSPGPDGTPLGGHSGHLGHWYMGHVEGVVAQVHFTTPPRETIFGYERDVDGTYVRRRFAFDPSYLQEQGLANIVAWLANPELADARHRSGPLSFAYLALASPLGRRFAPDAQRLTLTGSHVPGSPYAGADPSPLGHHVANLLRQPVEVLRFVFGFGPRRFFGRPRAPGFFVRNPENTYPLQYHGEHLPRHDSKVTLSSVCDELGMPRLDIDLRFGDGDVDTVVRAHAAWDAYLRRHDRGWLEYLDPDVGDLARRRLGGGFHQVGTTRMSARAEDGVVDRNLAVHGMPDLYVAGSSVCVTSSQANSTFMGLALALRLARHLQDARRSAIVTRPRP